MLAELRSRAPTGYLSEAAALREAEAAESLNDRATALRIYEHLAAEKLAKADEVWFRLAKAAIAVGNREKAAAAFHRVYYEFPLGDFAVLAGAELDTLRQADRGSREILRLDLGRALRLFGSSGTAKRATGSRRCAGGWKATTSRSWSFASPSATFTWANTQRRETAWRPYLKSASRRAEARFFSISARTATSDDTAELRGAYAATGPRIPG